MPGERRVDPRVAEILHVWWPGEGEDKREAVGRCLTALLDAVADEAWDAALDSADKAIMKRVRFYGDDREEPRQPASCCDEEGVFCATAVLGLKGRRGKEPR